MAVDPQNKQYGGAPDPFGRDASAYASTGASGSGGITPEQAAGPVIATPQILVSPFSSSQVASNLVAVPVTAGDTCASAADAPVPGTDPLTGLGLDFIANTGAGQGNTHTTHPGARP